MRGGGGGGACSSGGERGWKENGLRVRMGEIERDKVREERLMEWQGDRGVRDFSLLCPFRAKVEAPERWHRSLPLGC